MRWESTAQGHQQHSNASEGIPCPLMRKNSLFHKKGVRPGSPTCKSSRNIRNCFWCLTIGNASHRVPGLRKPSARIAVARTTRPVHLVRWVNGARQRAKPFFYGQPSQATQNKPKSYKNQCKSNVFCLSRACLGLSSAGTKKLENAVLATSLAAACNTQIWT